MSDMPYFCGCSYRECRKTRGFGHPGPVLPRWFPTFSRPPGPDLRQNTYDGVGVGGARACGLQRIERAGRASGDSIEDLDHATLELHPVPGKHPGILSQILISHTPIADLPPPGAFPPPTPPPAGTARRVADPR